MSAITLQDFIIYCESMGDIGVDHSNWSSCAIGTYLESVGIPVNHGYDYLYKLVPIEYSEIVSTFLDEFPKEILEALDDKDDSLDTYEAIAEALRRHS